MKLTRRNFIKFTGVAALSTAFGGSAFSQSGDGELAEVRVAYPPTMAALPLVKGTQGSFYLDDTDKNAFESNQLEISLIPSKSPSDAARLVSGGKADCSITDLASAIYGVQGTGNLKVKSTAFTPNAMDRYAGLITSNLYEINTLEELLEEWLDKSGKKSIVLAKRRDEHYSTDELIKSSGISINDANYYLDGEDLISRMTGLLNGNYISAVLPEPLLTLALENPDFQGHQPNLLKTYEGVTIPPFVFVFNQRFLEGSSELVRKFYDGWNRALEETNNSNNLQLLNLATEIITGTFPNLKNAVERTEFDEDFANLFEVPTFSSPEPLDESIYDSVMDWAIDKGFLPKEVPYERVIDSSSGDIAGNKDDQG
ncbi:MAG: ABC transporter substrate-binding protein [Candidatus Bipolaricaulota bacterium]